MISISDNTATDQLLKLLGRQTVEAELALAGHGNPELTIPFLSTLELFSLRADLELAERYAAADSKGKRTILAQLADQTRGSSDNATMPTNTVPTMIDKIEWFANTQDIRNLFKTIVGFEDPTVLSVMEVNKGISDSAAKDWAYVGYKGGSEPGVLNLSWLLRDEDGAYHTLVMSWTNTEAEVETSTFIALAERILALR